ncbi:MAG: methyltransferase domain-containing protein [Bryobacteraceae bacterium]
MEQSEIIDSHLLGLLECPRDRSELHVQSGHLCCARGHKYPIVSGIPVFLLDEKQQTIRIAAASLKAAESGIGDPLYLETLGLSEAEKHGIQRDWIVGSKVDSVISYLIGSTSGGGYVNLIGNLDSYPIPDIPIGNSDGELLLDIGSNWGRWSVSAARKGWRVIGIDPSLGALMAAKRAFSGMGLDISFVCGDARFLPFKAEVFQGAFSYSVIQHFSEPDAGLAIAELRRVLRQGGLVKIQMAHKWGLRSTYIRTRRDYADAGNFRVRYWSLASMRELFEKEVGPSKVMAEAFGGLGLLPEDRKYVNAKAKILIYISKFLKRLSLFVPPLIGLADSVYIVSTKRGDSQNSGVLRVMPSCKRGT